MIRSGKNKPAKSGNYSQRGGLGCQNGMNYGCLDSQPLSLPVGQPRSPKMPPGPGHDPTFEHQNPEALNGILQRCDFPSAGGSTKPALGAMQEPIPDFI